MDAIFATSMNDLIKKYNVPGPRYTSYPTVPYWDEDKFDLSVWKESVKNRFDIENKSNGIAIYIHLPFCESLCTFCGCNKRITKNHSVEDVYIDALIKEWNLYLELLGSKPSIREIHLGGGTPTFFSPENLNKLLGQILNTADIHPEHEFGFEGHPNNTNREHLQTLYNLGFRRCSFGVQDYDPKVQKTINRIQSYESVVNVTQIAREIGYESISHDLVFGLPHQHLEAIEDTVRKTLEIKPDRISFYSYAHVPWIKGVGQRGFSEEDLPKNSEKRLLYERGREMFEANGYKEIGMDHFALESDSLYKAFDEGSLHRNFMGYSVSNSELMIGLGVSSIGDSWDSFGQNEKKLEDYYAKVNSAEFPIFRGHNLNQEDLVIRKKILDLMCRFTTDLSDLPLELREQIVPRLDEFIQDDLMIISDNVIQVKAEGIAFIRNICMVFDLRLWRNKPDSQLFSMTI